MAMYDFKPSVFEANNNGSYTYRWNIEEVQMPDGEGTDETVTKWQCDEVIVWGTVTREKITEAVITSKWDNDYEKKLINDYNAANMGVFGSKTGATAKGYIEKYSDFLTERHALKEQIERDCETLNIR